MDYEMLKSQLKGDYRDVFSKAYMYVLTLNSDKEYLDEKLMDLYDLLITAQTEEKPAEKIIGKNIEVFIKEFFSDFDFSQKVKSVLATAHRMTWILFAICILDIFSNIEDMELMNISTSVSSYIVIIPFTVLVCMMFSLIFSKVIIKSGKQAEKNFSMMSIWIFIISIYAESKLNSALNIEINISAVRCALISFGYIVIYNAVKFILRYKKYGTLKNISHEMKESLYYKELQNQDIVKTTLKIWKKRYEILSRKNKVTEYFQQNYTEAEVIKTKK